MEVWPYSSLPHSFPFVRHGSDQGLSGFYPSPFQPAISHGFDADPTRLKSPGEPSLCQYTSHWTRPAVRGCGPGLDTAADSAAVDGAPKSHASEGYKKHINISGCDDY